MVLLNKCCCCSLRTGCIIVGWIGLTSYFTNGMTTFGTLYNFPLDKEPSMNNEKKQLVHTLYYSILSSCIIGFAINMLLIIGAYKNKRLMLLPWLVTGGIAIVVAIVAVFIIIGLLMSSGNNWWILLFFVAGFSIALEVYLWLCVFSFYQRIREEEVAANTRRRQENQAFVAGAPQVIYESKPPSYSSLDQV